MLGLISLSFPVMSCVGGKTKLGVSIKTPYLCFEQSFYSPRSCCWIKLSSLQQVGILVAKISERVKKGFPGSGRENKGKAFYQSIMFTSLTIN